MRIPEWFTTLDWKSAWAVAAGVVGTIYTLVTGAIRAYKTYLEVEGQRLTNQRQRLELDALTLSLTVEERNRVAETITGEPLPDASLETFRNRLEAWAKGKALEQLQEELDELKAKLEESEEELARVQCPICQTGLSERRYDDEPGWGEHSYESYECGYSTTDDYVSSYCPNDDDPPTLDDYDLRLNQISQGQYDGWWVCSPHPNNIRAQKLRLQRGLARTQDGARKQLTDKFNDVMRRIETARD